MSVETVQEVLAPYGEFVSTRPIAERVVLHNISWKTFEALLKDTGEKRKTRFAYDRGTLEIMSPLNRHEHLNRLFEYLVDALAGAFGMNAYSSGALTCKQIELQCAIEPDSCFYVQNEPLVRDKEDIDLKVDPPPDLMVEVDIHNSSVNKLAICEAFRVPEHWRYDGSTLEIRILRNGVYVEVNESRSFPGVNIENAIRRLRRNPAAVGQTEALIEFRIWIRTQIKKKRK